MAAPGGASPPLIVADPASVGALEYHEGAPRAGRHITDRQARHYMNLRRKDAPSVAAAKASISTPSAYRIALIPDASSDATSVHVNSAPRPGADRRDPREQTEILICIRASIAHVIGALAAIESRRE